MGCTKMVSDVSYVLLLSLLRVTFVRTLLDNQTITFSTNIKKLTLTSSLGIDVIGKSEIHMEIKACQAATILLSNIIGIGSTSGDYFFLLIAKSYTQHSIRDSCINCSPVVQNTIANVLSCTQFKRFWLKWDKLGYIGIGEEGKTAFLEHWSKSPFLINYMQLTSVGDTLASWKLLREREMVFYQPNRDGSLVKEVDEVTKIGTVLMDLAMTLNTSVTYNVSSSPPGLCFVNNSQLILNTTLDYENKEFYTIRIVSSVGESVDAVVRVKDSNDESPVIAVPNRTSIPEELPVGAIVTWLCDVSDADAGDDLSVFLDDESRSFFSIQTDGSLTVKRRLDRDGESGLTSFNVTVIAEDEYGHSTSRVIFVTIDDVNDNAPSCARYLHIVSVEENTTNDVLIVDLNCTDIDDGDNGKLVWTLVDDYGGYFNTSGPRVYALAGRIDYEALPADNFTFDLRVRVSDSPETGRVRTTWVDIIVRILPRNEDPPVWFFPAAVVADEMSEVSIAENVSIGTVVATLLVNDTDRGKGGHVTYSLIATLVGNESTTLNPFSVDSSSGNVYTNISLDYDVTTGGCNNYVLIVAATDGDNVTETKLRIRVTDVDDNPPIFNQTLYITQDLVYKSTGDPVLNFKVSDVDTNYNITVFLDKAVENVFKVEKTNNGSWRLVLDTDEMDVIPDVFMMTSSGSDGSGLVGLAYVVAKRSCMTDALIETTEPTKATATVSVAYKTCLIPKFFSRFIGTISIDMPWKKEYDDFTENGKIVSGLQTQFSLYFSKISEFESLAIRDLRAGSLSVDLDVTFKRDINFSQLFSVVEYIERGGFSIENGKHKILPFVSPGDRRCPATGGGLSMFLVLAMAEGGIIVLLAVLLAVKCFVSHRKMKPAKGQKRRPPIGCEDTVSVEHEKGKTHSRSTERPSSKISKDHLTGSIKSLPSTPDVVVKSESNPEREKRRSSRRSSTSNKNIPRKLKSKKTDRAKEDKQQEAADITEKKERKRGGENKAAKTPRAQRDVLEKTDKTRAIEDEDHKGRYGITNELDNAANKELACSLKPANGEAKESDGASCEPETGDPQLGEEANRDQEAIVDLKANDHQEASTDHGDPKAKGVSDENGKQTEISDRQKYDQTASGDQKGDGDQKTNTDHEKNGDQNVNGDQRAKSGKEGNIDQEGNDDQKANCDQKGNCDQEGNRDKKSNANQELKGDLQVSGDQKAGCYLAVNDDPNAKRDQETNANQEANSDHISSVDLETRNNHGIDCDRECDLDVDDPDKEVASYYNKCGKDASVEQGCDLETLTDGRRPNLEKCDDQPACGDEADIDKDKLAFDEALDSNEDSNVGNKDPHHKQASKQKVRADEMDDLAINHQICSSTDKSTEQDHDLTDAVEVEDPEDKLAGHTDTILDKAQSNDQNNSKDEKSGVESEDKTNTLVEAQHRKEEMSDCVEVSTGSLEFGPSGEESKDTLKEIQQLTEGDLPHPYNGDMSKE